MEKTYVADAHAEPRAPLSQVLEKKYLRGRGRYGSSPHPKVNTVHLVLQEREKPLIQSVHQPWLDRKSIQLEQVYEIKRSQRPIKPIHC